MLFSEDYKSILEPATVANESSTDYMEVAADIVVEGASVLADISSIMNVAEGKAIEAYTEACGNESVIAGQLSALTEAADEGIFTRVKNFFKKLLDKLKSFWTRVVNWFTLKLKSNATFIKQAREKKDALENTVTIKGPDFAGLYARLNGITTIAGELQKAVEAVKNLASKGRKATAADFEAEGKKFAEDADKKNAAIDKAGEAFESDDVYKAMIKACPSLEKALKTAKTLEKDLGDLKRMGAPEDKEEAQIMFELGQEALAKVVAGIDINDAKSIINNIPAIAKAAVIGQIIERKYKVSELINQLEAFDKAFGGMKKVGNFLQNTILRIKAVFSSDIKSAIIHVYLSVANSVARLNNTCVDLTRSAFIALRNAISKGIKSGTKEEAPAGDKGAEAPKKESWVADFDFII